MEFREHRLPNGLEILAEVNDDAHSTSVGFFVRTGARDETDEELAVNAEIDEARVERKEERETQEEEPRLVAHLEDLPPRACHWPVGDPQAPEFAFCGRSAGTGPYCPAHAAIAYRGPGVNVAELARLLRR